jgi:hypothetical protein
MRLKEDSSSWKSHGIQRRDFRHDAEAVSQTPRHRSKRKNRKHIKGCEHVFKLLNSSRYYNVCRCEICGKRSYRWCGRYQSIVGEKVAREPVDPKTALEGSTWVIKKTENRA